MDIAAGSLKPIIDLAAKVVEAVKTVNRNKEVCAQIGSRVSRLSDILSFLENNEVMKQQHQVMRDPHKDLEEALDRALKLVTICKEKRYISHVFKAKDLSEKLEKVSKDIMEQMLIATYAGVYQNTIALMQHGVQSSIQKDGAPLAPSEVAGQWAHSSHSSPSNIDISARFKHGGERKNNPAARENGIKQLGFKKFSFPEMKIATNNFSENNLIGKGGSATVYKGELPDGFVAIKMFSKDHPLFFMDPLLQGVIEHYVNIFAVLPPHENVVQFLGYCHETTYEIVPYNGRFVSAEVINMMVVEEYIPHGTLSDIIDGKSQQLHWSSKFRIIRGIALGIAHLHTKGIIHLDLKPENILIDFELNPKICDFEMSEILDQQVIKTVTGVKGTLGYMAPEYIADGVISVKNDVFGFGLLLLYIIRGRLRLRQHTIEWAREVREAPGMNELFDSSFCDKSQLEDVRRCIDIGLLCTQNNPTERPTMPDVLEMLNSKENLASPIKPILVQKRQGSNQ